MNNYVELTELYSKGSEYDPEIENVRTHYGLRQVYVNLDHIVYIEENLYLKEATTRRPIIPGLSPDLASFSNVYLMSPSNAYKKHGIIRENARCACADMFVVQMHIFTRRPVIMARDNFIRRSES